MTSIRMEPSRTECRQHKSLWHEKLAHSSQDRCWISEMLEGILANNDVYQFISAVTNSHLSDTECCRASCTALASRCGCIQDR